MDIFTALAEPTRRNIIEILASRGQLSATAIADRFRTSPPAISQHLKVLREAHLVKVEKRRQQRIYRINPPAMLEIEQWAKNARRRWTERFDALEQTLKAEKKRLSKNHNKKG
jgi:DNA-binding transcriptional ArsR family regulator